MMSNYEEDDDDKLKSHYDELERKHRDLDNEIEARYNNVTVSDEVRRMKTMKLYLKDEMHRINEYLIQKGLE
jgi:hypothetical protein|tara:strand:- start:310 stop:525 length:216 start_codon:yes stop_codon:yes gene_type:complete